MVPLRFFLPGFLIAASALAQSAPTFMERIDVRITNVDVVVTDRKGNVVSGLTADDFEILAAGVPQKIVNFYEARDESAVVPAVLGEKTSEPAPPESVADAPRSGPPRRMILFVDNTSLSANQRKKILEQMRELIGRTLSSGDETMIVTYDNKLQVRIPFTRDLDAVRRVLDVVANEGGGGDFYRSQAIQAQQEILAMQGTEPRLRLAKAYAESARRHLDRTIAAIKEVMATVAGVDGRKIMVLASEGLPAHPGLEMFRYIEMLHVREFGRNTQEPGTVGQTVQPRRGGNAYTIQAEATKKYKGEPVTEMGTYDSREKIRELTRAANEYGLSLYPLHGSAVVGAGTADASMARTNSTSNVLFDLRANTEQAMKIMADQTGGVASVGSQHIDLFANIRADLTSYYSLGFRAEGSGERKLTVRVKKPGNKYTVRYRNTVVQKPVEQELAERVIANLFTASQSEAAGVALSLGAGAPHADGKVKVPVRISVPFDWLTLLEKSEEKTFSGGFEVYVAVVDARGAVSPVARRTQNVSVRDLAQTKGKTFPYTMQFLMNSNARRVSVAVVDTITQLTSFASTDVAMP